MIIPVFFYTLCIIHVLIWLFILFAFMNKKTAYINLFYIIPFVYIIHIFPIHFIEEMKKKLYPNDYKEKMDDFLVASSFGIFKIYTSMQKVLDGFCFCNPFGPQGMLIFGAITSAYSLKKGKSIN